MGIFHVNATLVHPGDASRRREIRFLVDSGAFSTVVPRDVLVALGIVPSGEETVQFADGRRARWKVGEARLELNSRSVTTLVLFGKKGTQPLLGAYSLEGLGLNVDARRRRLVRMPVVVVAAVSGSSCVPRPGCGAAGPVHRKVPALTVFCTLG